MNRIVIIPVYNEEKNIGKVLNILNTMPTDIVVIDNASTDNTVKVVEGYQEKLAKRLYRLHIIRHKVDLGKAQSLIDGINYATRNNYLYAVTMDGDMEHDPYSVFDIFQRLFKYDAIIGQRKKYRSGIRKFLNNWSRLWFNMVLPDIEDVQCGFRGFKVHLLDQMTLFSKGFEIEMELLLEAVRLNAKITTFDIETEPREGSNLTTKDYVYMNNFFDSWLLLNKKELKLPFIKKTILLLGARFGLIIGKIIETFI